MPERTTPLAETNRTDVQYAVGRQPNLCKVSLLPASCQLDLEMSEAVSHFIRHHWKWLLLHWGGVTGRRKGQL